MEPRTERRRAPRIQLDIRVHIVGAHGDETILLSHDWSIRSVFLRTLTPLPVNSRVAMYTVLGHPVERIPLSGMVVRSSAPRGPGSHETHGMAVALDELPLKLRALLAGTAQRVTFSPPVLEATILPSVLVVSEDHRARAAIARLLSAAGYDIAIAEHAPAAAAMFANGTAPRALLVHEDSGETLSTLREHLPESLELVIVLGETPRHLGPALGCPLLLAPRMFPPEQLEALLHIFVQPQDVELEGPPLAADGPHRAHGVGAAGG